MDRKNRVAQIRQLEQRLLLERLHCRELGAHPVQVIRRYRRGIVLTTGFTLGMLSGRTNGRRMISAVASSALAFCQKVAAIGAETNEGVN